MMSLKMITARAVKAAGSAAAAAFVLVIVALRVPTPTATAGPRLEVHGASRFVAETSASEGSLAVSGVLLDDAEHAVPDAVVAVSFVADDGTLLFAGACASAADRRGTHAAHDEPTETVTTQFDGTFCVRADARPGTTKVTLSWPGSRLFSGSRLELLADASRRAVALAFDPEPHVVSLGEGPVVLEVVARVASDAETDAHAPERAKASGLSLRLTDERNAPLGTAVTDRTGKARFVVSPSAFAPPGPGELRVDFDGDAINAKASKVAPCERHVRALVRARESANASGNVAAPSDGAVQGVLVDDDEVAVELDVTSGTGAAVPGGSVEGLLRGAVVGVAPVANGRARLVVRYFGSDERADNSNKFGSAPRLEARYVPDVPWYVAGPPLMLLVHVGRSALWRRFGVIAGGLILFAWFFVSRARALVVRLAPATAPKAEGANATGDGARVDVIAAHAASRGPQDPGWAGRVLDAHDGTAVVHAVVAVERVAFGSVRVLVTATTDERGRFVVGGVATEPGDRLAAEGPLHVRFERDLPVRGVLEITLISRRRAVLRRLVNWARRRGAPFHPTAQTADPTPAHVRRVAGEDQRTARWAAAVEVAAFGARPVDVDVETEVDRLAQDQKAERPDDRTERS